MRGNRDDDGDQHHPAGQARITHHIAQRFPVKGRGRHHHHDGHQRHHRHLRHPGLEHHHQDQQKHPGKQRRQSPAPAVFHIAHGLPNHAAACNATEHAGGHIGHAQTRALAVLVAGGVGHFIHHGSGQHRLQQTHHGNRQGRQHDDAQRVPAGGHLRQAKQRQCIRQLAQIGHRRHRQAQRRSQQCEHHHADQRGGNDCERLHLQKLPKPRQAINDEQAQRQHGPGGHVGVVQVRQLRGKDQDGQRIHKPRAHGAGDKAHQHAHLAQPKHDLHGPRQQARSKQVLNAVRSHQGRSHQRNRARCCGHHGRASAKKSNHDADDKRGEQAHRRIHPRHKREGDHLRNQCKRGNGTGQQFTRNTGSPFRAQASYQRQGHTTEKKRSGA